MNKINSVYLSKILLTIILAVLLSITIVIDNHTLLFFVLGSGIGLLLHMRPEICFWVIICLVFVVSGLVSYFFPSLSTIRWGTVLISLILGVRSILELLVYKNTNSPILLNRISFFLFGFIVVVLISTVLNDPPVAQTIVALKNYFQLWPLFFALAIIPFSNSLLRNLGKSFILISLTQVPIALYQYIYIGPIRYSYSGSHISIADGVVGTFGTNMYEGGGSSFLSLFQMFTIGYLISLTSYKMIKWWQAIALMIVILSPLLINETKISFLYLLIIIIHLPLKNINMINFRTLTIVLALFLTLFTFFKTYTYLYGGETGLNTYISNSIDHNFGDKGHGKYVLNRTTAPLFWLNNHIIGFNTLFGNGLGASRESSTTSHPGTIASHYKGYGINITLLSRLLWDTGILGTVSLFGFLFCIYFTSASLEKSRNLSAQEKALAFAIRIGSCLYIANFLYKSGYLNIMPNSALIMILGGLTSILLRKHKYPTPGINAQLNISSQVE